MEVEGLEKPRLEGILEQLTGSNAIPILAMSGSIYLAIAGTLVDQPTLESLVASIAVGLAMIGSLLELRLLLVIQELEDSISGKARGLARKAAGAALRVALFYTIIGVLALAWKIRSVMEAVRGLKVESGSACLARHYKPVLMVVTLGMYLAVFQRCAVEELALSARALLEESPIDLGAKGYKG